MDREAYSIGRSAERDFAVTDAVVRAFAEVSGDTNPVHLDDAYAAKTIFRGRVAHGMLIGSYISAVLAEELPGPGSIYLAQTLNFEHPIRIGDTVKVKVTVKSIEGSRMVLTTVCTVDGKVVIEGEATALPPRKRKARAESA
jgi:3-hydroxybutyryl-CoA dehydratase